jgi:hypothetical protein
MTTLDEKAEEAANKATCQRCETVILSDSSAEGVVFGRLIVPILGVKHEYQLCGKCGLGLREYVFPKILEDDGYLAVKNQLLTEHWL